MVHILVHITWFTFLGSHFSLEPVNHGSHNGQAPLKAPYSLTFKGFQLSNYIE